MKNRGHHARLDLTKAYCGKDASPRPDSLEWHCRGLHFTQLAAKLLYPQVNQTAHPEQLFLGIVACSGNDGGIVVGVVAVK